jgi:hypothetical protein
MQSFNRNILPLEQYTASGAITQNNRLIDASRILGHFAQTYPGL